MLWNLNSGFGFSLASFLLLVGVFFSRVFQNSIPSSTTPEIPKTANLYISTMTHMEGNLPDDKNKTVFLRHVDQIRYALDLFDAYGAKATIESEKSFAKANTIWGINILKEVVERGHGVGTHADIGASLNDKQRSVDQFANELKDRKELVDTLVGTDNNRGLSGGTGYVDWVLAASQAEFSYRDELTGFAYLAMSENARPSGWTDAYIRSTGYHDSIPPIFSDRLYPLPLANAKDLQADANDAIIIMSGGLGELPSLSEGRTNCSPNCVFDEKDVQAVKESIDEAIRLRDLQKMARINMHIPLDLLQEKNETTLRSLLSMIESYVDQGKIIWATQGESYDAFVASRR